MDEIKTLDISNMDMIYALIEALRARAGYLECEINAYKTHHPSHKYQIERDKCELSLNLYLQKFLDPKINNIREIRIAPSDGERDVDKARFVYELGHLLTLTREGIVSCEYLTPESKGDPELVRIHYNDGKSRTVCVDFDSNLAIIADVLRGVDR